MKTNQSTTINALRPPQGPLAPIPGAPRHTRNPLPAIRKPLQGPLPSIPYAQRPNLKHLPIRLPNIFQVPLPHQLRLIAEKELREQTATSPALSSGYSTQHTSPIPDTSPIKTIELIGESKKNEHPNSNKEYNETARKTGILTEQELEKINRYLIKTMGVFSKPLKIKKVTSQLGIDRSILLFPEQNNKTFTVVALHEGKHNDIKMNRQYVYEDFPEKTNLAGMGGQADVKFGQIYKVTIAKSHSSIEIGEPVAVKIFKDDEGPKRNELLAAREFGMILKEAHFSNKDYLVTPLFPEKDLFEQIREKTYQTDQKKVLRSISTLIDKCCKADQSGWVDGDLKAENLIVTTDGEVKFFDFGGYVAKTEIGTHSSTYTFEYLAPEERIGYPTEDGAIWRIGLCILSLLGVTEHLEENPSIDDSLNVAEEKLDELFPDNTLLIHNQVFDRIKEILWGCLEDNPLSRLKIDELKHQVDALLEFIPIEDTSMPQSSKVPTTVTFKDEVDVYSFESNITEVSKEVARSISKEEEKTRRLQIELTDMFMTLDNFTEAQEKLTQVLDIEQRKKLIEDSREWLVEGEDIDPEDYDQIAQRNDAVEYLDNELEKLV